MPRNEVHDLQVAPTPEQAARQRFVLALKQDVDRRLRPQLKSVLDPKTLKYGNTSDIAMELEQSSERKCWGRLARSAQELMWEAAAAPLHDNEEALTAQCAELLRSHPAGGSLELNPTLALPQAMSDIPVHLQPGGYCLENSELDIMAGALYEAGGALYSQGQSIGLGESKAELVIRFLSEQVPQFRPQKILDMACSAGGSSTPYARLFPGADVHALDVAPGLLRYASARDEAMGLPVHFHQRDARNAGFDQGSFDLVVSHNAMHEMPPSTIEKMMSESHRLLRPGGIAVHQDVPLINRDLDTFARADYAWDRLHNNEPYWASFADMDLTTALYNAGFGASAVSELVVQLGGGMAWNLVWAQKAESNND